jgi:hypothetical protein
MICGLGRAIILVLFGWLCFYIRNCLDIPIFSGRQVHIRQEGERLIGGPNEEQLVSRAHQVQRLARAEMGGFQDGKLAI